MDYESLCIVYFEKLKSKLHREKLGNLKFFFFSAFNFFPLFFRTYSLDVLGGCISLLLREFQSNPSGNSVQSVFSYFRPEEL